MCTGTCRPWPTGCATMTIFVCYVTVTSLCASFFYSVFWSTWHSSDSKQAWNLLRHLLKGKQSVISFFSANLTIAQILTVYAACWKPHALHRRFLFLCLIVDAFRLILGPDASSNMWFCEAFSFISGDNFNRGTLIPNLISRGKVGPSLNLTPCHENIWSSRSIIMVGRVITVNNTTRSF